VKYRVRPSVVQRATECSGVGINVMKSGTECIAEWV
jgi:hypothetical protein